MDSSVPRLSWILITYETYFFFFNLTILPIFSHPPTALAHVVRVCFYFLNQPHSLAPSHLFSLFAFFAFFTVSCSSHPHTFTYEHRVFNKLHSLGPSFCLSDVIWTRVSPEQTVVLSNSPWLELNSNCLDIFLQSHGILKRDFFGGDCNSSADFWGRIYIQIYLRIHTTPASDSLSLASSLFPITMGAPADSWH